MRHKTIWAVSASCALTATLVATDHSSAAIAWWLSTLLLFPAMMLTRSCKYLAIKTFVWLTWITQEVTILVFYLNPENYAYQAHRPYAFTGWDSYHVLIRLGIFLLIILIFSKTIEIIINSTSARKYLSIGDRQIITNTYDNINNKPKITSQLASILIIVIIALMVPVNQWMFEQGIGMTGVEPPRLRYRISGIMSYFRALVVPAVLSILYLQTSRRSLPIIFCLGLYSAFAGISSVSKAVAVFPMIVPMTFAYKEKRWMQFYLALIFCAIGVSLAVGSRSLVYVVTADITKSDTSMGIASTIFYSVQDMEWKQALTIIQEFVARLESFRALWLSSQVNPESLGGGWAVWKKAFNWNLVDLGLDALHLEVLGHTVPQGFYNVSAGMLAHLLWAMGESWMFLLPFALLTVTFLCLEETAIRVIQHKYKIHPVYTNILVVLLAASFFVGPGYPLYNNIFIFIVSLSLIPKRIGALTRILRICGLSHGNITAK